MKKLLIGCVLFPFLVGCGHPVVVGLAAWLSQPKSSKKHRYIPVPLQVTTDTLPYAVNNQPYSEALQAVGGSAPYTWSEVGGPNLPSGLTLLSSGTIDGTPLDTATDYAFTVEVMDSVSTTATKQLTLTLYDPLAITLVTPLPDAVNGQAYGPETVTAAGGTGNITWSISAGTLPSGISLTTTNGDISGNPSDTATLYSFTVTVQDDAVPPQTDPANLSINLYDPLTINTATLPYAINGVLYSETLNATGGTGTYFWSQPGGTLPGGVSVLVSGVVEGTTPADTPGLFNFTVQVDDNGSPAQTDSRGLSIQLYDPLTITSGATLPTALMGDTYSETLTVSGGDSNYTWSDPYTELPGWLSLNSGTGELSAVTVGTTGLYTFTIRVTDGESPAQTDEVVFSLPVSSEMVWEDTFDDETKIDSAVTASTNYAVRNGYVRLIAASPGPGLDANHDPGGFADDVHDFGDTTWLAQTFTVQATGSLVGAELLHRRITGGTQLTFEIRDVVGGQPGPNVLATATFASPGGPWGWHGTPFTNPIDVEAGQVLAIVFRGTNLTTAQRAASDRTNPYAGGIGFVSTDSGGNWSPVETGQDSDIRFHIYVAPFSSYAADGTVQSVTISPTPLSEWVRVSWNDDTNPPTTDIKIQVLYDNAGSWDPIPDGDLAGNGAGFDTSPVDISGLSVLTYPAIRLRAWMTSDTTATPRLFDWQVAYKP
jgi:hypothetical protein